MEHIAWLRNRLKNSTKEPLQDFIQDYVETGSTIYTNEYKSYREIEEKGYEHETVMLSAGEWFRKQAHTNGIESF